jgi:hypothetical protein
MSHARTRLLFALLVVTLAAWMDLGIVRAQGGGTGLALGPAVPQPEHGADISGVGGGRTDVGTISFDLSAHQGPTRDFGHVGTIMTLPTGDIHVLVDVDCINVHGPGKRAVISGLVAKVSPTPNPLNIEGGDRRLIGIKDGGEPSAMLPVDDFITVGDLFPGVSCRNILYNGNLNNVTQGNVVIQFD